MEVEFVEKETEAVVGEGGCYYEFLIKEEELMYYEFYQQEVELKVNCLDMQLVFFEAIYMEVVLWLMK